MFEDTAGKKLLLIGSDASNIHIIDQARKMGVYTIAVDRETDHSKCPAKLAADEGWDMNYRDTDAIAARCREEGVCGVLAGYAEMRVLLAAEIAQKMGAPFYVTPEQMNITRDKRSFKVLCRQYGVPVPEEYCATGVITEEERDRVKYPAIVKPCDYGGRIGISVCYDRAELDKAIDEAMRWSEIKKIVVEEYIRGTELAAMYTLSDGKISLSLINDKYLSHEGHLYDTLCEVAITPSKYYEMYMETVDGKVRDLLRGIGMKDGVAFFQLIANKDKIVAFETGLRLNGGNDWKIMEKCNGLNQCQMLIRHCLTGSMGDDLERDDPCVKGRYCTFVMYTHGGEVGTVEYGALADCPNIIDCHPYLKPGRVMPDKGTTQQKAFSIKIEAKDTEELAEVIRFIQRNVTVKDVNGKNMLFGPFDTQRLFSADK